LAASKKSSSQTVLYDRRLGPTVERVANSTGHLDFIPLDYRVLEDNPNLRVQDLLHIHEYPNLPSALFTSLDVAKSAHDMISGFNAVGQMDSGGIETAAESIRMSESGENRVADDIRQYEQFLEDVWRKEVQIDYEHTPRRSTVRVLSPGVPEE